MVVKKNLHSLLKHVRGLLYWNLTLCLDQGRYLSTLRDGEEELSA